jgi:putative FmdB family regulatory protein
MRLFDFRCPDCGCSFEALVRAEAEGPDCPGCGSTRPERQPVLHVAVRTRNTRRGRVIDLSSKSCPCGRAGRGQAH